MESLKTDCWKEWLLKHRYGGSEASKRAHLEGMSKIRDRILKNAELKTGETLLDVGTGEGLIGFGALETEGTRVIFSDISEPLVDLCQEIATQTGVSNRCEFIIADATDLSGIPDTNVDVVTTRSVLIYVADKEKALSEFFRVLRPGGRISIFEPIAKVYQQFTANRYFGIDVRPIKDLFDKIKGYGSPDDATKTMSDFDDRDLVRMAIDAGFIHAKLELEIQVGKAEFAHRDWETLYNQSPNPLVPTLRQQVESSLTQPEQERFMSYMKEQVESAPKFYSQAYCWLTAQKAET
jgi:arsenite methyltransferase